MNPGICTIVLSGGRGSRLNHQDKGLVEWQQRPLIHYVIDKVQAQTQQLIISCNRNRDHYQSFGFECVSDTNDEFLGPLAGLSAAQESVKQPYCLVCCCDTPLLPSNLATTLLAAMVETDSEAAYPVTEERAHYLPLLVKTDLLSSIEAYLQSGRGSVRGWLQPFRVTEVDFSGREANFININTEQELSRLKIQT